MDFSLKNVIEYNLQVLLEIKLTEIYCLLLFSLANTAVSC